MIDKQKIIFLCLLILIFSYLTGNNQKVIAQTAKLFSKFEEQFITTNTDSNTTLLGQWVPSGPCETIDIENKLLFTNNGTKLLIADITDRVNPVVISETELFNNTIRFIKAFKGYLYYADGDVLHIIDVSDPQNPEEVSTYGDDQNFLDIVLKDNYAYLADYKSSFGSEEGLRIINIEDPVNPSEVKFIQIENPNEFELNGKYLYLICNNLSSIENTFYIIDIEDPAEPIVNEIDLGIDWLSSICLNGKYVYVIGRDSNGNKSLFAVDISDQTNPSLITSYNLVNLGFGTNAKINLAVNNNYLYLPCSWGCGSDYSVRIMDINDPSNASIINNFETEGTPNSLIFNENYVFVADGAGGLRIYDVSEINNVEEVNYIDKSIDLNFEDIAVYNDYVYILGYNEGLHLIDISDQYNPQYVKTITLPDHSYCIKIKGDYAYIINEGLRIFDLSVPSSPNEVGYWEGNNGHDLVIDDDIVFITYESYLYMIDVSNKNNPDFIGEYYSGSGSQNLDEVDVSGDYAFISLDMYHFSVTWGFEILNISDRTSPYEISEYSETWGYTSWTPSGHYTYTDIFVRDSYLYATHSYAGFGIFDVSDPTNPAEVSFYRGKMYGMCIEGNYAYVLDSKDDRFEIINITNPTQPSLAGYYEINGDEITVKNGVAYVATENLYIIKNDQFTDIEESDDFRPTEYSLEQNYPNPFNPVTTIQFSLKIDSYVQLNVYNTIGQKVATIANEFYPAGLNKVNFDCSNLPAGIYIYRIQTKSFSKSRKMILIK